jgi:uncharacterized phage-associated protein
MMKKSINALRITLSILFISLTSNVYCVLTEQIDEGVQLKISRAIGNAIDNQYEREDLETLKEWADKGHPLCQLHYGEYLLHMRPGEEIQEAAKYLVKAAEGGDSDAESLVHSVIGAGNFSFDEKVSQFCGLWLYKHLEDMKCFTRYTSDKVALYFIKKDQSLEERDLTPLKLQKLCYYAQSYHVAAREIPLFEESFQAWQYGPVIPSLYEDYKIFRDQPITLPVHDLLGIENTFDETTRQFLDFIFEEVGKYSAWTLSKLTHTPDTPWSKTWDQGKGKSKDIPLVEMYRYFKKLELTQIIGSRLLQTVSSKHNVELEENSRHLQDSLLVVQPAKKVKATQTTY